MRRWRLVAAAGIALAVVVLLAVVAVRGRHSEGPVTDGHVAIVSVLRRDLVTRRTFTGALGYADPRPLVSRIAGTITEVAPEGSVLRRGAVVYRVDTRPVALLFGSLPAWRTLGPGVEGGLDVRQLQRNLQALGYRLRATGVYDAATEAVVSSWQRALGEPATGALRLGSIVFLPGPRRVGAVRVTPGAPAATGEVILSTAALKREAVIRIPAASQGLVARGQIVKVSLPSGREVSGEIDDVGKVATARPDEPPAITVQVSVDGGAVTTLDQAPVSISVEAERRRNAVAVPVEALLALRGGGYALEVAAAKGQRRLVRVRLGTFADGYVEVSGPGITPGLRVTAAE